MKQPQCKATSKRSGKRCRNPAVRGNKVCRMHGAGTPKGINSPHFKNGRHSKSLPDRYIASYEASLSNKDQLSMVDDIALLDSRENELVRMLNEGNTSSKQFEEISKTFHVMDAAVMRKDSAKAVVERARLVDLLAAGVDTGEIWDELKSVIESRRRLAESERKRVMDAQTSVQAEQIMVLAAALLSVVTDGLNTLNGRWEVLHDAIESGNDGMMETAVKKMDRMLSGGRLASNMSNKIRMLVGSE